MNLIRIIAIGLAAWLIYSLLKRHLSQAGEQIRRPRMPSPKNMIRCARCGIHVPEDQAVCGNGICYCGEEHQRMGRTDGEDH